jgi:esterase/lipase
MLKPLKNNADNRVMCHMSTNRLLRLMTMINKAYHHIKIPLLVMAKKWDEMIRVLVDLAKNSNNVMERLANAS